MSGKSASRRADEAEVGGGVFAEEEAGKNLADYLGRRSRKNLAIGVRDTIFHCTLYSSIRGIKYVELDWLHGGWYIYICGESLPN